MNFHIIQSPILTKSNVYKSVIIQETPENTPLYDSDGGKSTDTPSQMSGNEMYFNDINLLKELYTELNTFLLPFVAEVIDNYDYNDSPIYDEEGISRETLAQLVSRVLDLASEHTDDVEEIRLEINTREINGGWNRNQLLNSLTESLILNDIFMYRRPRRRRIYESYSFKNGSYNGLNYK